MAAEARLSPEAATCPAAQRPAARQSSARQSPKSAPRWCPAQPGTAPVKATNRSSRPPRSRQAQGCGQTGAGPHARRCSRGWPRTAGPPAAAAAAAARPGAARAARCAQRQRLTQRSATWTQATLHRAPGLTWAYGWRPGKRYEVMQKVPHLASSGRCTLAGTTR